MLKRFILLAEILIFFLLYFHGPNGQRAINQLNRQLTRLEEKISLLKKTISNLQHDIDQWENEPFFKEKFARELLQMAYENEEIYYST